MGKGTMVAPPAMMKMFGTCVSTSDGRESSPTSSSSSSSSRSSCFSFRFGGGDDGLLWFKDLGRHAYGQFSMAVVQANTTLEDSSHFESGPLAGGGSDLHQQPPSPHLTLVGVFDGHGGAEASRYVANHIFSHLRNIALEQVGMSDDAIRRAFLATEEGFLAAVRKQWLSRPQIASAGSCCLVGVVCAGILYVANLGDSRAVLGRVEDGMAGAEAVQLTEEHNASNQTVRDELRSLHPDDPQIVVLKHNVWRVRGLIQISRSIGDAYLKDPEFNQEPLTARFRLAKPFSKPLLSADPSITTHKLSPQDRFLVFASDGLWEHLSNQAVVDIIQSHPRSGIARRLVKAATREAAKKREVRYSDLKKIESGVRRHFHDDISVVVIFLEPSLISRNLCDGPIVSLRGDESLLKQILHA